MISHSKVKKNSRYKYKNTKYTAQPQKTLKLHNPQSMSTITSKVCVGT